MDFANGLYYPSPLSSLLTTTRASTGYAATSSGLLVSFASNTPRITDLGLLVEQAATNVVLWNRDLTNAAWVKSNITAALNQTGADGTANSATSLTATAGNGTCLQAITLASSARFQSAYVKRLTGSGVINMTLDNGATWTVITVTAAYTQLTIPTQTLANPTVGFRIVTSGDAIAVDLVGNETGTFATSPIATTAVAVTRAADAISMAVNNSRLTIGSLYTKVIWPTFNGTANIFVEGNSGASLVGATLAMTTTTNYEVDARNGATAGGRGTSSANAGLAAGATARLGVSWDSATTPNGSFNGAASSAFGAQSEADWAGNSLSIGSRGAGNSLFANTYIQRVTVWYNQELSTAQLAALP